MDGQTTCHGNTVLCVASRGKNEEKVDKFVVSAVAYLLLDSVSCLGSFFLNYNTTSISNIVVYVMLMTIISFVTCILYSRFHTLCNFLIQMEMEALILFSSRKE